MVMLFAKEYSLFLNDNQLEFKMHPCVLIVTDPRHDVTSAHYDLIRNNFPAYFAGDLSGTRNLALFDLGSPLDLGTNEENGAGGGAEPAHNKIGRVSSLGCAFTVFLATKIDDQIQPDDPKYEEKFPKLLRFEMCIPFDDAWSARKWVLNDPIGQEAAKLFNSIVLVPLTKPTYLGTNLKDARLKVDYASLG
jgi:hypothetical protein